ncbi:MAG: SCO family protein [Bacteroidota bacterium]
MRWWLFLLGLLAAFPAAASEPPANLEFVQRLDAQLPLKASFRDEDGRPVHLGDYFGQVPVVIVLGYFSCPNLCSTLLDGVLESLARAEQPVSGYRLLAVSIDPRETPADGRRRREAFRSLLAPGLAAHFLTGSGESSARLAGEAGFPYAWDQELGQYMHPAGFLVATPEGRVARYFLGVRFAARDLRLALVEASAGRAGSLADRLLLLCSHYDPKAGRYTVPVMVAVRAVGLLVLLSLGGWIWCRRTGRKG